MEVFVSDECVICMDNIPTCFVKPCGHMACCSPCLVKIRRAKNECPVCRVNMDGVQVLRGTASDQDMEAYNATPYRGNHYYYRVPRNVRIREDDAIEERIAPIRIVDEVRVDWEALEVEEAAVAAARLNPQAMLQRHMRLAAMYPGLRGYVDGNGNGVAEENHMEDVVGQERMDEMLLQRASIPSRVTDEGTFDWDNWQANAHLNARVGPVLDYGSLYPSLHPALQPNFDVGAEEDRMDEVD